MKKYFSFLLVAVLVLGLFATSVFAADLKVGKVEWAAHGTKCFTVAFVVLDGDTIIRAFIDEYQFLPKAEAVGVPNSDVENGFAADFANPERVLASKRLNNDYYSNNMAKAGSTVTILDNFIAIEKFAEGMTIAELEGVLASYSATELVDTVTGATLVDTQGYLTAILEAAKAAQ
ncbi:MAG TPA: hypothetical protein GX008_04995 [Firmicutes bacterium]|jgi:hypothetical protein|nr:MAG: hypothetical protein AA931_04695 [Peptococcaceae bacterium 1109]HHT73056.1 hypothetical protein [Bacillota bacterium]